MKNPIPLCVDLDGTLIYSDMLHESAIGLLKAAPLSLVKLPWVLLMYGKAALKRWIASKVQFDAAALPYNQDLIFWLRAQRVAGRPLILCTASDHAIAQPIAEHLGIFDEVMASDGSANLEGSRKAAALVRRFGEKGFDYAGNSTADLAVWRHAHRAIVVNAPDELKNKAAKLAELEKVIAGPDLKLATWLKALRIHQWLKNALLFVPLLAAHRLTDGAGWLSLLWAFVAFSLCASSVYVANDLLDLESERQHPRKSKRPFASGVLPIWKGALIVPILLAASCFVGLYVGATFFKWLMLYFFLTCVYST